MRGAIWASAPARFASARARRLVPFPDEPRFLEQGRRRRALADLEHDGRIRIAVAHAELLVGDGREDDGRVRAPFRLVRGLDEARVVPVRRQMLRVLARDLGQARLGGLPLLLRRRFEEGVEHARELRALLRAGADGLRRAHRL